MPAINVGLIKVESDLALSSGVSGLNLRNIKNSC